MLRLSLLSLALLLLSAQVRSQCTDGCLKCNKIDENSSVCEICDAMGFYVPFGVGLCLKLEIENCEVPTVDRSESKCLRCVKDHIFDTTTNKCKKVAKLIENCNQYDSSANCQLCAENYYLNNKACTAVETDKVVANCLAYESTNFTCLSCKGGFFLNSATKKCESITTEDNCIAYTQNKCLSCASGYIKDENFKLTLSYDTNFMKQVVQATVDGKSEALLVNSNLNDCKKTTVLHCATFETFNKCTACNGGYYLTEEGTKCALLPQEPIKNCLVYSDATTCVTCVNGAYKVNTECKASSVVKFCETYSQSADACLACEYGYFLNSGACQIRVNTKTSVQCKMLNPDKDECLTCNPNFTLNVSKSGCLAIIPNCEDNAVDSNNVVTCTKCLTGYGKDSDGMCKLQEVANCKDHTTNALTCTDCDPGFYRANLGKECLENTVKNCADKSRLANECLTCNKPFFKDSSNNNSCSLQNIEYCETFVDNENVCTKCMDGFFPNTPAPITSCTKYTLVNCKDKNPNANTCDKCEVNYYKNDSVDEGCSLQSRADCKGYVENENVCNQCDPGYFLDATVPAETYCKKKERAQCKEFDNTIFTHDQCKTCNDGYYLNSSFDCLAQTLTNNCATPKPNFNECQTCKNLFYVNSSNSNQCSAITSTSTCAKSDGVKNECEVCQRGYFLDSTSCTAVASTAQVDTLCSGNKSTTTGTACTECPADHTRFIVSAYAVDVSASSHSFTNLTISNCLKFSNSADSCLMCKEGFESPIATQICKDAKTSESCLQKTNAGITEALSVAGKCNKCNDDYYQVAAVSAADNYNCTARTNLSLNCEPGYKTKDANSCDMCAKNSRFDANDDFAICMKDLTGVTYPTRCKVVDIETPTECLSCEKNEIGGACDPLLPTNGSMFNSIAMDMTLMGLKTAATDQSNNCHASKYYGLDYHLKISCAVCAATKFKKLKLEDSGNSDSKKKVNGQTFIGSQVHGTNEKESIKIVPFTNIPASDGGCYSDLNTDFANKTMRFDVQNGDKKVMKFNPDTNPQLTTQGYYTDALNTDNLDPDNASGFFQGYNTVDPTNSSDPNYTDVNAGDPTNKGTLYYLPTNVNTKKIKYYIENYDPTVGTTFSNVGKYGHILELDTNTVVPISCQRGNKATFTEYTGPSQASGSSTPIATKFKLNLTNCETYSTTDFKLKKRYEGLGYGNKSIIPLEALIQYDSCIQESELFFFVGEVVTTTSAAQTDLGFVGETLYNISLTGTDGNQFCIPKEATSGDSHVFVENCQVHLNASDAVSTFLTDKQVFQCISCKPGYKPNYTGTNVDSDPEIIKKASSTDTILIMTCDLINNCDISNDANNTWMNMCQTCKHGFSWAIDTATSNVELDSCVENTISNCMVMNKTSANGCAICERGYDLTSDTRKLCVPMEIANCKKYNFQSTAGLYTGTAMTTNDIDKLKNVANLNAFLQWAAYEDFPQYKTGCNTCESNYKPAARKTTSTTTNKYCLGTSMTGFEIANCEFYSGITHKKCRKCKEGFIVLETTSGDPAVTSYTCVAKNVNEKNCISKNSAATTGANCTKCEGFRDPIANKCYEYANCDVIESSSPFHCDRCKEGYKPKANPNEFDCEPIPSNDVCLVYLKNNVCIKCKSSTLSPVNLMANDVSVRVNCVKKYDDKLSTGSVNDIFAKNVYFIDSTTSTVSDRFKTSKVFQPVGQYAYSNYMSSGSNPKVSVCLESPVVDHCKTYDSDGFRKCTECLEGYKLKTADHSCVDGTVDNCVAYSGDNCTKCHDEYFLESATVCKKRNNTNCKTYFASKDNCTECFPNQWYEAVGTTAPNVYGLCHEFTEENCFTPSQTSNACSACVAKQRYLNGGTCHLYTKKYCKDFKIDEDKCTACNNDRFLNTTTHECDEYTAKNCNEYEESSDACKNGCKEGFFASGNTCLPPAAKFCLTRKTSADECEECLDDYWKNGTVCEPNTAVNCLTKSKTANECTKCAGGNYSESNVCKPHSVEFCSVFTSNANTCDTCATGYYTDGGMCKLNTTVFCTTKSGSENKCEICNDKYYKDASGMCKPITNVTCVTIKSNTNECETCLSTRYKELSSGECKELTVVENCMTYQTEADQCKTCKTGFYKSADSLACFPNPNGILGCTTYSDLTTCTTCKKTHFLQTNTCVELTQAAIDNCASYSGDGICATCDTGYSLDGAACASNVETSCLTWANKDTCATCAANEILEAGKCAATAITGCAVTSGSVGSETCLKCSGATYLDANECKASSTTIDHCVEYSGDGICKMCASTKVVSKDGSQCVDLDKGVFGPNCASGSTNSAPICAMCTNGFMMDNQNKCSVACEAANCLICNPDDVKKCNLCQTGYHMTDKLECEENNQVRMFVGIVRGFGLIALFVLAIWK